MSVMLGAPNGVQLRITSPVLLRAARSANGASSHIVVRLWWHRMTIGGRRGQRWALRHGLDGRREEQWVVLLRRRSVVSWTK